MQTTPNGKSNSFLNIIDDNTIEVIVEPETSSFDPYYRLQWVEDYMEGTSNTNNEFCIQYAAIPLSSTDDIDNEIALISVYYEENLDRAVEIYEELRTDLNKPVLKIYDSNSDIAYVSRNFSNYVSLISLFEEVVGLSSKYKDVHNYLNIKDEANVDAFGCDYSEHNENIPEGPYWLVYVSINSQVDITGATIYLNSIYIDSRNYTDGKKKVMYEGFLRVKNYYGISDQDLQYVNKNLPLKITTYSATIEDSFDSNNPSLDVYVYPEDFQIDITTIMQNLFLINSLTITPPKGLSSIKYLQAMKTKFFLVNKIVTYIDVKSKVSYFEFLDAGIGIENSLVEVEFFSQSNYTSTFTGNTTLEDLLYSDTMTKKNSSDSYETLLTSNKEQMMDYYALSNTIFASMSDDEINIFSDSEYDNNLLSKLNIAKPTLHLYDSTFKITLSPYILYKMQGYHDVYGDGVLDCFVQGSMANLDGAIQSVYNYIFDYSKSQDLFFYSFNVKNNDTSWKYIDITKYMLTTANKDFDEANYIGLNSEDFVKSATSWPKGMNATVEVKLKDDWEDDAFCQFMKSKDNHPITLSGIVNETKTELTGIISDLYLNPLMTMFNTNLLMIIKSNGDNTTNVSLKIKGDLYVTIDDIPMIFYSTISFDQYDRSVISLSGLTDYIYQNIYNLDNLIDIIEAKIEGNLLTTGEVEDFSILGSSVLGHFWYNSDSYSYLLINQESRDKDVSYYYNNTDVQQLTLVNTTQWKIGNIRIYAFEDNKLNYFKALYELYNVPDMLKTMFDSKDTNNLPQLLKDLRFPSGTSLKSNLTREKSDMHLFALTSFYGVNSTCNMDIWLDNSTMGINITLPSFSIGSGNVLFPIGQDIYPFLNISEDANLNSEVNKYNEGSDASIQNNIIYSQMQDDSLSSAEVRLDSNVAMFDIIHRVNVKMEKERTQIPLSGRPFKGAFDADLIVNFKLEMNLVDEQNSWVDIQIIQNNNFVNLGKLINSEIVFWVDRIIQSYEDVHKLKDIFYSAKSDAEKDWNEVESWDVYSQWKSSPTIICKEYAKRKVWIETDATCEHIIDEWTEQEVECTVMDTNGKWLKSIKTWNKWERSWANNNQEVWIQYQEENITDQCILYDLECERENVYDRACVSKSYMCHNEINYYNSQLEIIEAFDKRINALYKSATEIQNLTVKSGESPSLFNLTSASSEQKLNKVISSDSIIFDITAQLFKSWNDQYYKLYYLGELTNDLENQEDELKDYQNNAIRFDSIFDFDSTNSTAEYIALRTERIVWEIYGIQIDEAKEIQLALRDLGMIDGNSTICPITEYQNDSIHIVSQSNTTMSSTSLSTTSSVSYDSTQQTYNVDSIYSENVDENEIGTYVYSY